jgi:argininosuccinate lyase
MSRFRKDPDPRFWRLNRSLAFDSWLAPYDIDQSKAHARGLCGIGVLSEDELTQIEDGLDRVRARMAEHGFQFEAADEDIHMAIERLLGEEIGPLAGKLHTGRSRNDQVATDVAMVVQAHSLRAIELCGAAMQRLLGLAETHADWTMPGYTHLQRAQPVTAGHHLLAHAEPLLRDGTRVLSAYAAASEMPLGSAALAGTTLPLDRQAVAAALGFERLTANSMDAVSDRDFALDLVYACLSIGLHLSRLAEDLVLWATSEFGFVRLADEASTGSSIMPQKRNPDIAELIRGRSGRALASLSGLAMLLKGLPLAYDRDLQEDKRHLFSAVDNCLECLEAARLLVERLDFDAGRLAAAVADPDLLATDTAERLVAGGRAFREVHGEVGQAVLKGSHRPPWDAAESLGRRALPGGPAPAQVKRQAAAVKRRAAALAAWAGKHS